MNSTAPVPHGIHVEYSPRDDSFLVYKDHRSHWYHYCKMVFLDAADDGTLTDADMGTLAKKFRDILRDHIASKGCLGKEETCT